MGKKQHQKDKMYLTTKEWKELYGGHKDDTETRMQRATFKRLPFTHCALSFLPFETPVCSHDGIIFDLLHVVPFVKKYGVNPVTGKKMSLGELIHLNFDKDEKGNYRCPVTFRVFTASSNIVAIRTTGNVYSLEAVQELNLKPNYLKDLLTDKPFHRKDIITLQDPKNLEKFNMEKFHHIKLNLKAQSEIEAEKKAMQDPKFFIRRMNNETKEALSRLAKEYVPAKEVEEVEEVADELNAAHYSQGKVAAGFTSTTMEPVTKQKAAILDAQTVRYARVKKNGYVRIVTNYGAINLELYCKQIPRACENFITHCKNGYYNNTKFHRIIRNFMMQGGDPSNTGSGGESIWGKPFQDEIVPSLSHDKRGVLSMANRGTDTNQSQFFITFRPCKYLDGKHTIFGQVVGGTDTLNAIEKVETGEGTDRPLMDVLFLTAEVFVDPFEEAEAEVQKERQLLLAKKNSSQATAINSLSPPAPNGPLRLPKPKAYREGVGKYLNLSKINNSKRDFGGSSEEEIQKKKRKAKSQLSDFSSW
uniref:RING-type E3 ubiquitin-protein ligase PPIL2 n=1 Tax=Syphacia muris TaxID=451379 RepID=A0A0N5AAD5_9BILA